MIDNLNKALGVDEKEKTPKKMHPFLRSLLAGLSLSITAAVCTGAVIFVDKSTKELIAQNQSNSIQSRVLDLMPKAALARGAKINCYNVGKNDLIGPHQKLFVASFDTQILGYVLTYQTSLGYSDPLVLIAGFDKDKKIHKVDIQFSLETPGLGDKVDRNHGTYLDQFNGQSLESKNWDVKKHGGDFDFITGSTITSRATVIATKSALEALDKIELNTLSKCKVN